MEENEKRRKHNYLILILVLIIAGLVFYILAGMTRSVGNTDEKQLAIDNTQTTYVRPETPTDRSQNVTLPGWGGFTIPAGTRTITKGFEFHNPEENFWYVDHISVNGNEVESLVVDSGNQVELNHYLKLAGIEECVREVKDYDMNCFNIEKDENGEYTLEGIGHFEKQKEITVVTDKEDEVTLQITCSSDCYYMSFGLYLSDNDELLYQSDLVSPGMYIQKMEMTRSLEPGTYDAYVVIQPYRSDRTTKTNNGVVRITLTAA